MTTSEARYKILLAQKKIERAKIKIKELKLFIESKEGRREDILKDRGHENGRSIANIATDYKLSKTRVSQVIHRIEFDKRKQ